MLFALAVLEEGLDVVIVQARFVSHVAGLDPELTAARRAVDAQQCGSQQIIECVAERRSSGTALTFDALGHVVIQRNCCTDAHDASSLASQASFWRHVGQLVKLLDDWQPSLAQPFRRCLKMFSQAEACATVAAKLLITSGTAFGLWPDEGRFAPFSSASFRLCKSVNNLPVRLQVHHPDIGM